MEGLKEYIKDLQKIREELKLKVTDEIIFSESCSFLRGKLASESRLDSNKPTEKQINFLKKHEVKIPATKKEATELISTYIANQDKNKI